MFVEIINPRFNETDAFGHINNTVYAIWFDASRQNISKIFEPTLNPKKLNLIMAHISIDYLSEVFYGTDVKIETYIEKIGTSSIHVTQKLYQNNKLATTGKAILVHYNHELKKSIPIPYNIILELQKHFMK